MWDVLDAFKEKNCDPSPTFGRVVAEGRSNPERGRSREWQKQRRRSSPWAEVRSKRLGGSKVSLGGDKGLFQYVQKRYDLRQRSKVRFAATQKGKKKEKAWAERVGVNPRI